MEYVIYGEDTAILKFDEDGCRAYQRMLHFEQQLKDDDNYPLIDFQQLELDYNN